MSHRKISPSDSGDEFKSIVPLNELPTKTKRWRSRVSLRTLLVLVALLALASLWFSQLLERAQLQKETVEWIRKHPGSSITYDFNLETHKDPKYGYTDYTWNLDQTPKGVPEFLIRWLGIDFFATVKQVDLIHPTSIEPLSNLDKLVSLDLVSESTDIAPLNNLKNLKYLYLHTNDVTDLTPLQGLNQLESLVMNTSAKNLEPLSDLKQLRYLCLHRTKASDISPLFKLTEMTSLVLSGSRNITNLNGVSQMKKLRRLSLYDMANLTDLSPLKNLVQLKILLLGQNQDLTDYSALRGMSELEVLELRWSGITDLSPLQDLRNRNLKTLDLSNCTRVTDLKPLKSLARLHLVELGGNKKIGQAEIDELVKELPANSIDQSGRRHFGKNRRP